MLNYIENKVASAQNPPLVVLHGLFGSAINFTSILEGIKIKALAFDLRNHGKSFHALDMGYDVMAEDVIKSLERLNISNCNLLGHSMGGKVALAIVKKSPEVVNQLIIADMSTKSYPSHNLYFKDMLKYLFNLDLKNLNSKGQALEFLTKRYSLTISQFLLTNLKRDTEDNFYWQVNLPSIYNHLDEITGSILTEPGFICTKMVSWIAGKKSDYLTVEIFNDLLKNFPNSKYFALDAGHWLHVEQRNDFTKIINDLVLT